MHRSDLSVSQVEMIHYVDSCSRAPGNYDFINSRFREALSTLFFTAIKNRTEDSHVIPVHSKTYERNDHTTIKKSFGTFLLLKVLFVYVEDPC